MKECRQCGRCLSDAHAACPDDGATVETVFEGPGTLDDKYLLLRSVGGGGMARVYRARHLGLQHVVAVKVLRPVGERRREAFLERFRQEAEVLARLRHPRLVEVTDFGVEAGREIPYLVMELLDGTSLSERVRTEGPLAVETALPLLRQVAEALDHVHRSGVVHGDLKPSNAFVTPDAGGAVVKLLDFGLARVLQDPERTPPTLEPSDTPEEPTVGQPETSSVWGTPGYIAPELYAGASPSPASDVYSFGALAFSLLVGRPPEPASAGEAPPRASSVRSDLAAELDDPLAAPLAREPGARPASAGDCVRRIRGAAERVHRRRWLRSEAPRRLILALALGVATAALAFGVTLGPLEGLENRLVDLRFRLSGSRPLDTRLLLVVFDDATLEGDPTPLVDKADEAGRLLQEALAAGSRGVALDLLLPAQWGDSPAFSDLLVRNADRVVLAAYSPPGGPVVGPEAVGRLTAAALGPSRAEGLFAYVNVMQDPDGVARRARARVRDARGHPRSSFPERIAELLGAPRRGPEEPFWIDFTLDGRDFETLPWRELSGRITERPETLAGRLLLVGADFAASGDRRFRVPRTRRGPAAVSGSTLHALAAQTLVEGRPVRSAERKSSSLALGLLAFSCASVALLARRDLSVPVVAGLAAASWFLVSVLAFGVGGVLVPTAAPLVGLVAVTVLGFVLRRGLGALPHLE